ncbi:hypothetical protein KI614_05990 [Dechloromonas denitrificans]|uniref:hypothetical protein n=1 Tax=Dechloromonas denitrificans TaxID=281362 RepID=UPI001CF81424|nr:hypothetical protein [Dechloromonas denitrificans]UCV12762.1 hypothetical protein KI614_05990 [Dechloromonas denitrificans]
MLPPFSFSPVMTLAGMALGLALVGLSPLSGAAEMPAEPVKSSLQENPAAYKDVSLKDLVAKSRTDIPGQRIIFAPSPIKFQATLSAMPAPQKADYLMTALSMMKVSNPPKVSQRIGLDFGGDKALAAYIDDSIAARLASSAKIGQTLTFYAFHIYNNNRGPALLITSFGN